MPNNKNAQKCPGGNTESPGHERSRAYAFTSFLTSEPFYDDKRVKYLGYGEEICPTTQKKHWQGFVYFFDKVSIRTAQMLLKIGKSHMEKIMSDFAHNEAYCSKENHYHHFGTKPQQGKRYDLEMLRDEVMMGKQTVDEICVAQPNMYHQYGRTLERLEQIKNQNIYRQWMTTCDWVYGKTGTGKSHYAFQNYNPNTHYILNLQDNGFWDGYKGQPIVIINEFRGQIPYGELLDLIDKWPKTVKIKGKPSVPFLAHHIIITTSMCPREIYNNLSLNDDLEQLMRRINLIHL